jgi:uncharacterized metal-binding protein YceD (DUF177 family)
MSDAELSRPVRTDTLGTTPRTVRITADPAERAALARRFNLVGLGRLEAEVHIHRGNPDIMAEGRLEAELVQSCVATDVDVPASLAGTFTIRFRPEPANGAPEDEVELGEEELDVMFYDGAMLDVGEAVAQTLALNLDPYPRAPDAADALREAGVVDEGTAGPFGALAGLKDRLGK